MANYSVVAGATFTPFSFERYLQPLSVYGEEYKRQETAIADLYDQASVWEKLKDSALDKESYDVYKQYADGLKAQADSLAANGLSLESRRALVDLKRDYNSIIKPIEETYNRRKEVADQQAEWLTKDPTLRFANNYSEVSLKDLMKNPMLPYSGLSGAQVEATTRNMAQQFAQKLINNPSYQKVMNDYFYQVVEDYGYEPEQIANALANDPKLQEKAPQPLKDLIQTVHDTYKDNDAYDRDFVQAAIARGLTSAIGVSKSDYSNNPGKMSAEAAAQIQLGKERLGLDWAEFNFKKEQAKQQNQSPSSLSPNNILNLEHLTPENRNKILNGLGIQSNEAKQAAGFQQKKDGTLYDLTFDNGIAKYIDLGEQLKHIPFNQAGIHISSGNSKIPGNGTGSFKAWPSSPNATLWSLDEDDLKKATYDELTNKGKQTVRNFISKSLKDDKVRKLSNPDLDEIGRKMVILKDHDTFGNDDFIIAFPHALPATSIYGIKAFEGKDPESIRAATIKSFNDDVQEIYGRNNKALIMNAIAPQQSSQPAAKNPKAQGAKKAAPAKPKKGSNSKNVLV